MIGNGVSFLERSSDPWYRVSNVTAAVVYGTQRKGFIPTYRPSEAASPLGCVEQFQFCRSSDQACGPLAAWADALLGSAHLFGLTPDQILYGKADNPTSLGSRFAWYSRVLNHISQMTSQIPSYGSSRKLLSEETLELAYQSGLREDQWKHDVSHWWSTWQSLFQISFLDIVKGPPPSFLVDDRVPVIRPGNQDMRDMCNNQVRSQPVIL